jgi:nucleoside-triphosphatase THEP1
MVQKIPWSVLGPEFVAVWGRNDPRNPQPEHLEILGPTGSGKTFLLAQILVEMIRRRKSSIVFVATKAADESVRALGWPIVDAWREVRRHDQVIFWPRTSKTGRARQAYQESRIQELLDNLWCEDSNTIVVFDEFAYLEALSANMKATLLMYLREGRSHGITCVMGKQRAQGVARDMHSESVWTIAFRMTDRQDNERVAEIFGDKKAMLPVVENLDQSMHEFLIQHQVSRTQYISWVDKPVDLKTAAKHDAGYRR